MTKFKVGQQVKVDIQDIFAAKCWSHWNDDLLLFQGGVYSIEVVEDEMIKLDNDEVICWFKHEWIHPIDEDQPSTDLEEDLFW